MHPIRRNTVAFSRGVTLIELVVAMVLVGIIVAATAYFFYPVTQSVDLAGRAELTDIADNALQRIGREVRLALPNSVRQTTSGSLSLLGFLPVRTAGRYRSDGGGAASTETTISRWDRDTTHRRHGVGRLDAGERSRRASAYVLGNPRSAVCEGRLGTARCLLVRNAGVLQRVHPSRSSVRAQAVAARRARCEGAGRRVWCRPLEPSPRGIRSTCHRD